MARNLIIFSLVVLSMIAIASSETKKKDLGKIIVHGTVLCKQGNKTIEGIHIYTYTLISFHHFPNIVYM